MFFENVVKNFIIFGVLSNVFAVKRSIVWYGGGLECENKKLFFLHRQCQTENVIATKALTANNEVFIITPRFKRGVPATLSKVIQKSYGVRLEPFLDRSLHLISDCQAIQNAVDFHLDSLANLWILDTGVVETLTNPKCTCHPKVMVINVFLRNAKVKRIDLSSVVQPESVLQNIIVEYRVGGSPFIYISDPGTGRIIVHEVTNNQQWTVKASEPTSLMALALVKHSAGENHLVVVRQNETGWLEGNTAKLRRKGSYGHFKWSNHNMPAITLLGSNLHQIYFRYQDARDVFAWKSRQPFINTSTQLIHTAEPQLNTLSVALDGLSNYLILDSNYNISSKSNDEVYHKLNFVLRVKS